MLIIHIMSIYPEIPSHIDGILMIDPQIPINHFQFPLKESDILPQSLELCFRQLLSDAAFFQLFLEF